MNYHIEHHLFQNVPFNAPPRLNKALAQQLPQAPKSLLAAWKEIFPALMIQRENPNYFLKPNLSAKTL